MRGGSERHRRALLAGASASAPLLEVGLLSQTLIVNIIHTQQIAFIQSRAATPLMVMTSAFIAVGIFAFATGSEMRADCLL